MQRSQTVFILWATCVFLSCSTLSCKPDRPDDWVKPLPESTGTTWEQKWTKIEEVRNYHVLSYAEFQLMETKLAANPYVEIRENSGVGLPLVRHKRFFVLRASENPDVYKRGHDFYIIGGVLSHSENVSVKKIGVVVSEDVPPANIYMEYTIAQ